MTSVRALGVVDVTCARAGGVEMSACKDLYCCVFGIHKE